jgi:hypothetical protein
LIEKHIICIIRRFPTIFNYFSFLAKLLRDTYM